MESSVSGVFKDFKELRPDGRRWYYAGFPGYPRNFSRDTFVSAILSSHEDLLITQLAESSIHQAEFHNSVNGAMPGKIHHEMPGISVFPEDNPKEKSGLFTTYNACDTNGLYLINAEQLSIINQELFYEFVKTRQRQIENATMFILEHTIEQNGYLFMEKPPLGAKSYRLRVTYWKDSILPNPEGKVEPVYPVFYPQAHFIAARGILSASRILKDESLSDIADKMFKAGISLSINEAYYLAYQDAVEVRHQPSSDELHSLAYIPTDYTELLPGEAIIERARKHLSTPFGFACTPENISNHLSNQYHGYKVWPWEQAMIAYGAKKFNLPEILEVAQSVAPYIGTGQEVLDIRKSGKDIFPDTDHYNDRQLFSVAAHMYLNGDSLLSRVPWL